MTSPKFSSLSLKPDLLGNLVSLGYESMTPIQEHSLPKILAGEDVIAQGKTGSGKTAAFGLGLLQKLEVKKFRIQSLVLCPTRELADQVAVEIRRLARNIHNIKVLTLCGGVPFGPQAGSLEHGSHIIVGTPGRIEDHLNRGTLSLFDVNMVVLDEADRMLDMGFQETLDNIIGEIPENRQTLLFSATFPKQIQSISHRIMNNPAIIKIEDSHDHSSIEQHFYKIEDELERFIGLRLLLAKFQSESTLVFCNTKIETQEVADNLNNYGFNALAIHGDLDQKDRDQTLIRFSNKSTSILVATDVASRGLDIDKLDTVINYNVAHDPEIHTHRVGRTGRAGASGIACTLYNHREAHKIASLDLNIDAILDTEELPSKNLLDIKGRKPSMVTLQIDGGKKQKIRPGDILGALTGKTGISGKQVGKINLSEQWTYVAVSRDAAYAALDKLNNDKIKGRSFRVRLIN